VIKNIHAIAAEGVKEIVLTGVNLGDFGHLPPPNLPLEGKAHGESFLDLVKAIEDIEEPLRFRISSIEPNLLKNEIIEWVSKSKKFVPHFHIPLQSGSDTILKKMRRRYLSDLYAERVSYIKSVMPHCCIGVDVIVGFPGETDELFLETYNFLNELDISYLHVFTYSERANTLAAESADVVPIEVRRKRNRMLQILSEKKLHNFYRQNIGAQREVLFEGKNRDGFIQGYTDNYIRVNTPFSDELVRSIAEVELGDINSEGIVQAEVMSFMERR
jgi:threonylcarbamoyladenosine tRNA methylthiotransferase MtaB